MSFIDYSTFKDKLGHEDSSHIIKVMKNAISKLNYSEEEIINPPIVFSHITTMKSDPEVEVNLIFEKKTAYEEYVDQTPSNGRYQERPLLVINLTEKIRASTARVVQQATHVHINEDAIPAFAKRLSQNMNAEQLEWNHGEVHYFADVETDGPWTCQYVFVLDALNFCFWPVEGMEYEHLANGLRKALEKDPRALTAQALSTITSSTLSNWFGPYVPPQIEERVEKIRELGTVLLQHFNGLALNIVKAANHSAVHLLHLVTSHITGFQDHTIYKGSQVYLYKRAQILVGDVWAAYGRRTSGMCSFTDIDQLTMFADYRVPQVLVPAGILTYSAWLEDIILRQETIPSGSEAEIEIRAGTIQAVERIHAEMVKQGCTLHVIELDWLLWQMGEEQRTTLPPHHRTLTVFY